MKFKKQIGLSLVELMISITAGMIVIGGVSTVYVSTIKSSATTLKQSKLNQETMTTMSVMGSEIRRAGIWGDMVETNYLSPETNPFSSDGTTTLTVLTSMAGSAINPSATDSDWTGGTTSGSCIVFAYDDSGTIQGSVEAGDLRGFRLKDGAVQMLINNSAYISHDDQCNDTYWSTTDDWIDLTDKRVINVTSLSFDLADSACLNTSEPDGLDEVHATDSDTDIDDADEIDCYQVAPSTDEFTTETRQVDISMSAELLSDSMIKSTVNQTIRVRNDLVTQQP